MNTPYLLAIHKGINLTFLRYQRLKNFFGGDFKKAFLGSLSDWKASGIDKIAIEKFFATHKTLNPQKIEESLKAKKIRIYSYEDADFPLGLKHIYNPPVILFAQGSITPQDTPGIAVIGSRKMTPYGKRCCDALITPLARQGLTIVSGMAYGTDSYAHSIALKSKSRTIAVLGSGFDFVYPKQNRAFTEQIVRENQGAVVSEYFPETEARAEYFPQRNRLVSALSQVLIITEASEKSGTLITAQWANEQGKEIFAVPGDIFLPQSAGTNNLIAQGTAHPLSNSEQVLQVLNLPLITNPDKIKTDLDDPILSLFCPGEKIHIDEMVRKSTIPQNLISSGLTLLEIQGHIRNLGNQTYVRNV